YAYDGIGQRKFITEPGGGRFTSAFDANSRIVKLIDTLANRYSWTYDNANRVTVNRLGNGTRASYQYDNADQILRLANVASNSTTISSFDYRYDPAGNRTRVAE